MGNGAFGALGPKRRHEHREQAERRPDGHRCLEPRANPKPLADGAGVIGKPGRLRRRSGEGGRRPHLHVQSRAAPCRVHVEEVHEDRQEEGTASTRQ